MSINSPANLPVQYLQKLALPACNLTKGKKGFHFQPTKQLSCSMASRSTASNKGSRSVKDGLIPIGCIKTRSSTRGDPPQTRRKHDRKKATKRKETCSSVPTLTSATGKYRCSSGTGQLKKKKKNSPENTCAESGGWQKTTHRTQPLLSQWSEDEDANQEIEDEERGTHTWRHADQSGLAMLAASSSMVSPMEDLQAKKHQQRPQQDTLVLHRERLDTETFNYAVLQLASREETERVDKEYLIQWVDKTLWKFVRMWGPKLT